MISAYKACKKSWVSEAFLVSGEFAGLTFGQMDEMKEQKRREAKSWFS